MELQYGQQTVRVFILSHRTTDPQDYWNNILNVVDWSEKYGCSGVLLFEGNDTFISPWVAAQSALARTKHLSPLVAVNPIYMHPFSAAKLVSSLTQIYGRPIFLNMITGTALNYLEAMRDTTSHDHRYDRLGEYIFLMRKLLEDVAPVTFNGTFYQVDGLQLLPGIPSELQPVFLLSGQSEAARQVTRDTKTIGTQMLSPTFEHGLNDARAINFGVLTRPTEQEAWQVANDTFPDDEEEQMIQEFSMQNTDSMWKKRMAMAAKLPDDTASGYWMGPFRNFRADGPYLVGSYERVAEVFSALIRSGIHIFIIDLTPREEEYVHIAKAFELVRGELGLADTSG
jgi:alkanesulfonate monooxygenase